MNLREFLEETGMPKTVLAKRAGVSVGNITHYFYYGSPTIFTVQKLIAASKGQVVFEDVVKECQEYKAEWQKKHQMRIEIKKRDSQTVEE